MRYGYVLAAIAAAFFLQRVVARAAEPDPWAGEQADVRERMAEQSEAEVAGELGGDDLKELNAYWASHLRRCPMNAVESAHYSIAELHLQRGNGEATIAALEKALQASQDPEVRNVTELNLAEVHRRRLNEPEKALAHYRKVTGDFRFLARHYAFTMLAETGKADQAAKLLDELAASTKEKGEQLALLHRLAALHKQFKMDDQALAIYQRITKDFTPADIKDICAAATAEAEAVIQKIAQARRNEDGEGAERLEGQLHRRARGFRLANRWDELKAFNDTVARGMEKLNGAGPRKE